MPLLILQPGTGKKKKVAPVRQVLDACTTETANGDMPTQYNTLGTSLDRGILDDFYLATKFVVQDVVGYGRGGEVISVRFDPYLV